MPVHSHPSELPASAQAPNLCDHAWASDVLPQLPPELATQARSLKAFSRVRGIACASDLLRALLAFVLLDHSTRSLSAWAVLVGLADLSEAAWRKRLLRAASWLDWLLSALLSASPARPLATTRRVRLIDATCVSRVGSSGDGWRVHYDYDLTRGCLGSVTVTPYTQGEHLDHYPMRALDILVADGGYGYRRSVATAVKAGADVVLRIHPRTCPLEEQHGQPFDLLAWLREPGPGLRQWQGYCVW